jgi:quinol monooxygenase YgiN
MAFVVCARWTARDGHEQEVEDAVLALAGPSRAEPGIRFYQANRDPDDARVFFFYEVYEDRGAYEAHGASEHFARWGHGVAIPLLASRERSFYETFGALEERGLC